MRLTTAGAATTLQGPFLLCDLGGTLVEIEGLVRAAGFALATSFPKLARHGEAIAMDWARRTLDGNHRARGVRFAPEREIAARALQAVLREAGVRLAAHEAAAITGMAWTRFASAPKLFPGVNRTWLGTVRRLCSGMGIVTDGDVDTTHEILDRTGIRQCFDSVTISEQVRAYKPEPKIFEAALRSLGAEPRHTLFVSDSARDLRGASKLGMAVGLVPGTFPGSSGRVPKGTVMLERRKDLGPVLHGFAASGRFAAP